MKRILVTGMSGVGKSRMIGQLQEWGYKAIDVDDPAWSDWADSPSGAGHIEIDTSAPLDDVVAAVLALAPA
ncbi:hypothetical protein BH20ACT5_BH20ACT5_12980 [soil metagenome]